MGDTDQIIKDKLNEIFKEVETCLGFKPTCYIAGGCIASIVLGESPKDYDMWFELPDYFDEVDKSDYVVKNQTKKSKYATTVVLPSGKEVQFVRNRMGIPSVLVPTFDFEHTQSYYTQDGTLVYNENFIRSRTLVLKGPLDHPMNTMERVLKFSKRGFYVPFETLQNLMLKINALSADDIKHFEKHAGSL